MTDQFPTSLQESILAALIFDDRAGAAIALQVTPALFDDSYREIAEKTLAYRRKYGRGPGRAHLDDLFDARLQDNNRPSRVRRLLIDLAALAPELNSDYIVSRTQHFVREQQLKTALVAGNSRWEQGGDEVAQDIEAIFHKALKYRAQGMDAGTFLGDQKRALRFMDRDDSWGIPYGVTQLNQMHMSMRPKELTLYIGSKSSGKSWAAIHMGKQALAARKKVLHITCEMSEDMVTQRYFQSLFSAGTSNDEYMRAFLEVNSKHQFVDLYMRKERPKWNILAAGARKILRQHMHRWGTKLDRLVIKEFPSGSLTLQQLESYLDYLDQEHKFQPSLLILDYPDLMSQDSKNYRISIGRTFVGIRGLLVDRHMAGFCPTQGNRSSLSASKVSTDMVAEDVSKLNTADNVFTYSRTPAEKARNLARLSVATARNNRDGAVIILVQAYSSGQYVLDSTFLQESYWDVIKSSDDDSEA